MKKVLGYYRFFLPLILFFILLSPVLAQTKVEYCGPTNTGIKTAIGCLEPTPQGVVTPLFRIALSIGGGIAFILILLGAFQIQISTGDPKKLQQGREMIEGAIIGLLMIIFSIVILKIVGVNILGIPGFS